MWMELTGEQKNPAWQENFKEGKMTEGDVLKKVVKAALSKKPCTVEAFGSGNKIIGTAYTRSKGIDLASDIKEAMKKRSAQKQTLRRGR